MGRAVEVLNTFFRLRDCKNSQGFHFSNQLSLFDLDHRPGCLRYEIGTCSGPCAGKVSLETYNTQVSAARSFLDGFNDEPLSALQESMERAALNRHYEYAARLRDDLKALEYLYQKLLWLADARRRFAFVYATRSHCGGAIWYLIRAGEVVEAIQAPNSPAEFAAVRKTLKRWQTEVECQTKAAMVPTHTLCLWSRLGFVKYPDQLERTFSPNDAGRKYRGLARSAVA